MNEAAYTQADDLAFPGYVNVKLDETGTHMLMTVRGAPNVGGDGHRHPGVLARLEIGVECWDQWIADATRVRSFGVPAMKRLVRPAEVPEPVPPGSHGSDAIVIDSSEDMPLEELRQHAGLDTSAEEMFRRQNP